MKRALNCILMLFLLTGLWHCIAPEGEVEITALEKSVTESGNSFAMELFPALSDAEGDKNVLISPFSISTALSMTYNGARGATQTAMAQVLCYPDISREDVNRAYKDLTDYLKTADDKVTLNIANSLWINEIFNPDQDFIDDNREYYDAEVRKLNFGDPASVDTINQWVSDKTEDKIESIIDVIPQNTLMYLINALYFKGVWTWEFDPEQTVEALFRNYDGTRDTVDMMHQRAELDYYATEDFQAVDLPYGDEKYSMTLILPSQGMDINTFIAGMTQSDWESWMEAFPDEKDTIDVYLPRFTVEYKIKLKDILSTLGMGIAFTGQADFTGIHPAGGIWINEVYHKTFIEVTEEGTEAAAVTAVEMEYTSADPPDPMIRLDRPFLFAIREKETGTIFFMGKILDLGDE
ncbi:MAG: serpin family protein [Candidatus Marinimicrobia bacterium]|nr:serpin family protein [Candidatus Neomarinimicrobiota bacterium]